MEASSPKSSEIEVVVNSEPVVETPTMPSLMPDVPKRRRSKSRRARKAPVVHMAPVFVPPPVPAPPPPVVEEEPVDPKTLGVVDQVVVSFARANRLSAALGFILGGTVPFIAFVCAHFGIPEADRTIDRLGYLPCTYIVLGCLIYSATTVYAWGYGAFRKSSLKALGFVLALEVAMTMVPEVISWVAYIPLVLLIAINGISTGCNLALDRNREATSKILEKIQPLF